MAASPLDAGRWEKLARLFEAARELEPDARPAYLDRACRDDPEVRRRVEDLLRRDSSGEDTLKDEIRDALAVALGAAPATGPDGPVAEPADAGLRGMTVGTYRLEEVIGHGGMGTVWRAVRADDAFRKEVAVKFMQRGVHDPGLRARFAAERQILASLEHPHIARLIDGGTSEADVPYVVMEYVNGRSIDQYCDEERLGTAARLALFRQVCDAVSFAHRNLVVHRDLKPGNILVTADGAPKLLDFGIAKLLDPERVAGSAAETAIGMRLLTPEYASPEQVRGEPITTASDVYALGVLLFGLLTGHRPYRLTGRSPLEMEKAICEQQPERPSTAAARDPLEGETTAPDLDTAESISRARRTVPSLLRRRLRGDLDNIVLKSLRKEPAQRYASADLLSEDIRRHLEGLPVMARPATLRYRAGKFTSRHRWGLAATAAVTLLVASLVGFYTVRLARERRAARTEARTNARVTDFLVELFKSADPMQARGEEVSARALLDRGARRIQSQLSEDPAIQARLLQTMGQAYLNLSELEPALSLTDSAVSLQERLDGPHPGKEEAALLRLRGTILTGLARYDEARDSLERAREIARGAYGPRHEEIVFLRNALANVEELQGNYKDAEAGYLDSLRLAASLPGAPDTLAAADTRARLGNLYIRMGRHDEAIGQLAECVRLRNLLLDADAVEKRDCLSLLGTAYREKGDYDAAEPLLVEDLRLSRKVLGDDSRDTAESLGALGNLYKLRGEPERALPLLQEALATRRRILGDEHPDVGQSYNDLANVLQDLGRLQESVEMQRRALAIVKSALGPDHPEVATNLSNLAAKLRELGRYQEAEKMYLQTLELDRKNLGATHPYIAMDRCNLAVLYMSMRRYQEAERLLRQALSLQDGNPDVNPVNLATTLTSLGNLLVLRHRAAEAEPLLRRAVTVREGVMAPDSVPLATSRQLLGRDLLVQGRSEEARKIMEPAYAILEAKLPPGNLTLTRATQRMVDLYEALGDAERAAAMRARIDQDPGHGLE